MNEAVPYADIIIIALIAGFVLLRLRHVLGQKTGFDGSAQKPEERIEQDDEIPVVQLPDMLAKMRSLQAAEKASNEDAAFIANITNVDIKSTLEAVKTADPAFSITAFINGARAAFEMVFEAFSASDKETLKMLLSESLYNEFAQAIEARASSDNRTETTLVSIEEETLQSASFNKPTVKLTLRVVSEQITVVRDKDGKIIDGNASVPNRVEDEWVFMRDITSRNPNWTIIDT